MSLHISPLHLFLSNNISALLTQNAYDKNKANKTKKSFWHSKFIQILFSMY